MTTSGRLAQRYINIMVKALAKEGENIIEEAARTKDTKVDTGNQLDAYGYAVYYNGEQKLVGYLDPFQNATEKHAGWAKRGIEPNTGRGWLSDFLNEYKLDNTRGFTLIVVNAAFYTNILERGGGNLIRKYRVISQVSSKCDSVARKYKGKVSFITYKK